MALTSKDRIDIYRKMLLARRFEETVEKKKVEGSVKGFVHLGIGQEAVGIGLAAALKPSDYLQITHRGHGYAIAKGASSKEVMAELYGKETGCCKARGGSMHIGDWSSGVLGCNGILGAGIVYTAGVALASKLQKTGNVVVCLFGDGASHTGAVHEGMNLAAAWDLPVVYVIENNLYAISTHIAKSTKLENLADRAKAYGMPGVVADGMDPEAVYSAIVPAIDRARTGKGPSLIELKTYRICGGAVGDKELYRTRDEVNEWCKKDPLKLGPQLVEEGVLTEEQLSEIKQSVEQEIVEAVNFAEESPIPAADTLMDNIYSPIPEIPSGVSVNPDPGSRNLKLREALNEAITQAMKRDKSVIALGEDIALFGGDFGVTQGVLDTFGPERIMDTPISENAIIGAAIGAGTMGMRPIAEIMFMDFLGVSYDQLLNQASKYRYMFGGQVKVPVVVRTPYGGGMLASAQHSQSFESAFTLIPGLKIAMPTTPYDAKGLLAMAIIDDNPVLFLEHKMLYSQSGPVPEAEYVIPFGKATIREAGDDVTIVATGRMVNASIDAANELKKEGITAEVIDPRTIAPFDYETVISSLQKTHRLVIVHEQWKTSGFGAEIAATIAEQAFDELDAPIKRVAGIDCPTPFAPNLAPLCFPGKDDVIRGVKDIAS